jgi:hypothetical protein
MSIIERRRVLAIGLYGAAAIVALRAGVQPATAAGGTSEMCH